jgi:hypothetical protein
MFEKLLRDFKDWFISEAIEDYEIEIYGKCDFVSHSPIFPNLCKKCDGSKDVHILARTYLFLKEKENDRKARS